MNQFLLNDKRIVVTGAASGIGKATADLLSELGASVISIDKNDMSSDGKTIICDLAKDNIKSTFSDLYDLDGLVHCAGIPYIAPLQSISKEKCNEVWQINTYAAIELSKHFVRKSKKGSIVYISSDHALVGAGVNTGYAASKAALHGITKSLAIELAPRFRVNCIAPGWVKTAMANEVSPKFHEGFEEKVAKLYPLGIGRPEHVAYCIAFLLSDASEWITGTIINVDGGFTAQ
ncbi:MAG TPA: SDR family oxidoreductase [Methanosarcinales archaeon]|nr:SDR family oxidoreductase [Methanosarcinales archaeon]